MVPRTTGLLVLFAVVSAGSAGLLCAAQQAQPVAPVRYHFGDDPSGGARWADPGLDESAWRVAQNGRWPVPPPGPAGGFEWTRVRVPAPKDACGPLAIRVSDLYPSWIAFELFVNGQRVARQGSFPPDAEPVVAPAGSVFELPAGLVQPGTAAEVSYRVWFQASSWWRWPTRALRSTRFEIGESRNLRLANHADHLAALLALGPHLAIYTFMAALGIGLFTFWRWAGGRELLLCSGFLVSLALPFIHGDIDSVGINPLPWRLDGILFIALTIPNMALTVEFIWAIHSLRARALKRILQASLVIVNACELYMDLTTSSSAYHLWIFGAQWVGVQVFSLIAIGVNLRPLFTRGKNWLSGIALAIFSMEVMLQSSGISMDRRIGHFYVSLYDLGSLASAMVLFTMLGQRGWQAWRARDELRVEFEAAREVQERLVTPARDVPGFRIESVYVPAKQVGGDFFRVLPEEGGGVLVVVGDVSGKGLKAAMTVSAIMGALRGCDAREPAAILDYLNRVLYGQVGGFVTCCVALITRDGAMTIANAGNPAPYCNGEEMAVEAGLPLGMVADGRYVETRTKIAPGDRLTFVSDGVVEATNPQGELYGFERTQAVSRQPAQAIAEAATQFGQEDDITVLCVTPTGVPAPARAPA